MLEVAPDAMVFAAEVERLDNTLCIACPGLSAAVALIQFDLEGIALSSGSACSSGKVARSHVLQAMGVSDNLADGALRISLGPETQEKDIDVLLATWHRLTQQQRRTKSTQVAA
ncbi:MAG: aminotransferase class V-fold PLP-dependent enzyme [Pseudomonadota bacterium]